MKKSNYVLLCAIPLFIIGIGFLAASTAPKVGIVFLALSFGLGVLSLIFSRKERLAELATR